MDPITHGVIGLAVSKLTGNEISFYDATTVSLVVGSIFPDADIIFQKWGDYTYLKNHRGITHSIVGIIISSIVIGGILSLFFGHASILSLIIGTFLGTLSHVFFDLFNAYGAQVLWPLFKKKYSMSLLNVVDPIFTATLAGYIFTNGKTQGIFISLFILYFVIRLIMRFAVLRELKEEFGQTSQKISLLPSVTGLFIWHFVLEEDKCNVIGERNMFKRNIRIIQRLVKIEDEILEDVLFSHVGKFFMAFTPMYHVLSEKVGEITRYVLIDMRYYVGNDFLHHAVLEVDENDYIVFSSFNAYSMKRSSSFPSSSEKSVIMTSKYIDI